MTEEELKPLGSNVPVYLKNKGYDEKLTRQILHVANEMAKRRGTRIIHLDFVLVADGTIRENQMGNRLVWQIRRACRRERGVGVPVGTASAPPSSGVRKRKPRKKAGS